MRYLSSSNATSEQLKVDLFTVKQLFSKFITTKVTMHMAIPTQRLNSVERSILVLMYNTYYEVNS